MLKKSREKAGPLAGRMRPLRTRPLPKHVRSGVASSGIQLRSVYREHYDKKHQNCGGSAHTLIEESTARDIGAG